MEDKANPEPRDVFRVPPEELEEFLAFLEAKDHLSAHYFRILHERKSPLTASGVHVRKFYQKFLGERETEEDPVRPAKG